MTKTDPSFLLDCAAAIASAPFDEVLDVAERCGLRVRDKGYVGYITTGYGIRAQTTAGPQQSVQAWARKVEAAFGRSWGRRVTPVIYGPDSAEILRRLKRKPKRLVELDEALDAVRDYLDRRPESVRAAIERKRDVQDAEDLRRFIRATAHLSDAEFSRPLPEGHPLTAGMGFRRKWAMKIRWNSERGRRHRRTAHEVIAEQRLSTEN